MTYPHKKGDKVSVRPMGRLDYIKGTIVDLDTGKGWIVVKFPNSNIKKIHYGTFKNLDKGDG